MERSSFFNSNNGDRKYQASHFAEYFSSLVTNGIFPVPSTNLQVLSNNNMTITIKAGKAWINGYVYVNSDDLVLTISVADGVLKRIDRIAIRFDTAGRLIHAVIKKGTLASSPVALALQRDADGYELGLADILITNGSISITQASITDLRLNTAYCGVVNSLIQADTTAIFTQYQAWYTAKQASYDGDFTTWTTTKKQDYDNWYSSTLVNEQGQIDAMELAFQNDFTDWFNNVKYQLSGDVAANLQLQITNKEPIITSTGAITDFLSGDKTFRNLANDVRNMVLTGLSTATNVVISAADTILGALGKLQKQITDHLVDYVRQPAYAVTTGVANTYIATTTPAPTGYVDGIGIAIKINVASTGASTLNWNGLGAKSLLDANGAAITDFKLNCIYPFKYESVSGSFILQSKGGGISKLSNLIKNGGFENSSNCWFLETSNGGTMMINTGGKFGTHSLSLTGSASGSEIYAGQTIPYIQGHKYYVSVWVFSSIAGKVNDLYFPEITPYPSNSITCTSASTWYQNSFISSNATIVSGNYCFRMDNNNVNTTNNMLFDGAMCIDLTDAYGAGKEPSKATMDALVNSFGGWWDSDLAILTSDATATSAQLLSGATAYMNGVKNMGTMVDISAHTPSGAIDSVSTAGRLYMKPNTGFWNGTYFTYYDEPNFIASNLLAGKSYFGLAGGIPIQSEPDSIATGYMYNGYAYLRPPLGYYGGGATNNVKSSQPDIVASNIISGKSIFGIAGSIPIATNSLGTQFSSGSATQLSIFPTAGYYGGNTITYLLDANYVASNIISGKSIFGLTGTATIGTLGGKRYASGSGATNASGQLIVSGLTFQPRIIIMINSGTRWVLDATLNANTFYLLVGTNAMTGSSVNSSGFVLSTVWASIALSWEAWE